jgi:hypothetical protein
MLWYMFLVGLVVGHVHQLRLALWLVDSLQICQVLMLLWQILILWLKVLLLLPHTEETTSLQASASFKMCKNFLTTLCMTSQLIFVFHSMPSFPEMIIYQACSLHLHFCQSHHSSQIFFFNFILSSFHFF